MTSLRQAQRHSRALSRSWANTTRLSEYPGYRGMPAIKQPGDLVQGGIQFAVEGQVAPDQRDEVMDLALDVSLAAADQAGTDDARDEHPGDAPNGDGKTEPAYQLVGEQCASENGQDAPHSPRDTTQVV